MTITLTIKEYDELSEEAEQNSLQNPESGEFLCQEPRQLGKGFSRNIEVYPEVWLSISDYMYHDRILVKYPVAEHPLQFTVILSGKIQSDHGYIGEGYTLISGGGIQDKMNVETEKFQRLIGLSIHLPPEYLTTLFPGKDGKMLPELKLLAKGNDWQTLIYPETTAAIQGVAQQIIHCPYQGITKRMYLQAKVLELITLQLAPILAEQSGQQPSPRLKTGTISRIYHASDILLSCLENPPSSLELAQMVGVSDRTLRYGFKEVFGTTVFGYLTSKRMEFAEKLLRQGDITIATVANQLGYSHQGRFAATFKSKFGITPSQCLSGKKSVSEP